MSAQDSFDQILIIGPPPGNNLSDGPHVLAAYPAIELPDLSFQTIIDYALPEHQSFCRTKKANDYIVDSYVFTLCSDNVLYYGYNVLCHPGKENVFFSSPQTGNSLFSFCIISRNLRIYEHLNFLLFLALMSAGKITGQSEFLNNPINHDISVNLALPCYLITEDIGHLPEVTLPDQFINAVKAYANLKPDGYPLLLSKDFCIDTPDPGSNNSLEQCSYDALFSNLQPEQITELVSSSLMDRQIVVIGKSLIDVSLSVLALTRLSKPISLAGTIIPLLPCKPSAVDILAAPTPFVIGTFPMPEILSIKFSQSTVFVNLDMGVIDTKVPIPPIPHCSRVLSRVKNLTSNILQKPFEMTVCQKIKRKILPRKIIEEISSSFERALQSICEEEVRAFFITDASESEIDTVFNPAVFLALTNEKYRPFFHELFESQSFDNYIGRILDNYTKKKGKPKSKKEALRNISAKFIQGIYVAE